MIPHVRIFFIVTGGLTAGGWEDLPALFTEKDAKKLGYELVRGCTITNKNIFLPRFFWRHIKSSCIVCRGKAFRTKASALKYFTTHGPGGRS